MTPDMNYRVEKKSGLQRIADAFSWALDRRLAALMPYYTLGYPTIPASLSVIEAIAPFSDLLELGIPFSDPIADGPTIQRSTQQALEAGVTTGLCLDMLADLRQRGIQTPALLMGYYNPILAYGEARFVRDAADAGADGFIVPDLPPEEASTLGIAAAEAELPLVHFIAPTTQPRRLEIIVAEASGFIYMVSVTGVTGARSALRSDLKPFVKAIKYRTRVPVAVGFGISTPEQAARIASFADGVIVGSALIDTVDRAEDKPTAAKIFIEKLNQALEF